MSTAVFEHAYYIGSYMSGILYGMLSSPTARRIKMISLVLIGVELVMYCSTLRKLLRRAKNGQSWKFFFLYSTILVLLLTIDISVNAVWGEEMWITHRDDEGGVPKGAALGHARRPGCPTRTRDEHRGSKSARPDLLRSPARLSARSPLAALCLPAGSTPAPAAARPSPPSAVVQEIILGALLLSFRHLSAAFSTRKCRVPAAVHLVCK